MNSLFCFKLIAVLLELSSSLDKRHPLAKDAKLLAPENEPILKNILNSQAFILKANTGNPVWLAC